MDGLKQFLEAIGPKRVLLMGAVALALVTTLGMLAWRGSGPEMAFLYTDLDPDSARAITEQLKAQNVPFEVAADGTAVLAPRNQLAELRMQLAGEKMGAPMGYEVLDSEQAFGVSAARSRMNEVRAIEGELSRSISTLQSVDGARVHIVMPERALFAAESRKATAAVTLKTRGRLEPEAIDAIRHLVSASVPELSPDAVSIIDQRGSLLARAGENGGLGTSQLESQQTEMAARLRTQIEVLLEPIVGQGKVRAEVAVVLNRARVEEESSTFDPDKAVVARQVTVESNDQSNQSENAPTAATIGAQLPENQAVPGAGGPSNTAARRETSEDVSYENSRINRVSLQGPGGVQRLTVAVMLDASGKGMPADQIRRLTRLVENAVGFNGERGDSVVVEAMAFRQPAPVEDATSSDLPLGMSMDQIISVAKLLIVGIIGLVAILLLKPRAGAIAAAAAAATGQAALAAPDQLEHVALPSSQQIAAQGGQPALPAPDVSSTQGSLQQFVGPDNNFLDDQIVAAGEEANGKAIALNRVGNSVASNPSEAAALIRQWMNN